MSNWPRADVMTFVGVVVAVLAIIATIATPEIRQCLHLDKGSCPWVSERSPSPRQSSSDNPNNSKSFGEYMNQGAIDHDSKNLHKAIEDYTQAIKLNPRSFDAYMSRGAVYSDLGDKQNAINDYTRAIHIIPNRVDAYRSRAAAYRDSGDMQKANDDARKAEELSQK